MVKVFLTTGHGFALRYIYDSTCLLPNFISHYLFIMEDRMVVPPSVTWYPPVLVVHHLKHLSFPFLKLFLLFIQIWKQ